MAIERAIDEGRRIPELVRSIAVASLPASTFAAVLLVLVIARPPSEAQRHAADPLVQLLDGRGGSWVVIGATIVALIGWRRAVSVRSTDAVWAAAGACAAATVALAVRAIVGSRLPAFIPAEEGARPGVTLGLAAGLFEEVVFRLALLPAVVIVAVRWTSERRAEWIAVVVTGALFALSHELDPAGGVFDPRWIATRFLVPGAAMSLVALRVNATFLVTAHCTAHLLLPALFR